MISVPDFVNLLSITTISGTVISFLTQLIKFIPKVGEWLKASKERLKVFVFILSLVITAWNILGTLEAEDWKTKLGLLAINLVWVLVVSYNVYETVVKMWKWNNNG